MIDTDHDGSLRAARLPTGDEVGGSCDWGGCDGDAVGVRWNGTDEGLAAWLAVCAGHALDGFTRGELVVPLYALPEAPL